jgi:purine-binding chemotaxis protein CheW
VDKHYLVFAYRGAHYLVDSSTVQEIVKLPELLPIEELPSKVVGAFNLRGQIIPVLDLALCFGHAPSRACLSDAVIVIAAGDSRIGIVANELIDSACIAQSAIEDARNFHDVLCAPIHFISGVARLDQSLAMVLNVQALLRCAPVQTLLAMSGPGMPIEEPIPSFTDVPLQDAEAFRERAHVLAYAPEDSANADTSAFAVIRLDSELFALSLTFVREFVHLRNVWPVPCCPRHIVGSMTICGDILTLVDLRPALGLAPLDTLREVAVVHTGTILMGVSATEIVDVVHLTQAAIASLPVADGKNIPYCSGIAMLGGRAISIIDIKGIVAMRALHITEEVR